MESNQQHHRQEADQEFQAALEKLQDILTESETEGEAIPNISTTNANTVEQNEDATDTNLAAWEDAVADIEQYLEGKTKNNS
jgi:gas vesicle protein